MFRGRGRGRRGNANNSRKVQGFRNFERHVERALTGVPHEFRPPIHCPKINFDVKINRVVAVHIIYNNTAAFTQSLVYGNVSEATRYYLNSAAGKGTQPFKSTILGSLTMREIGRICTSSMFISDQLKNESTGADGVIDVTGFSYFTSISINKVSLWGPATSGSWSGASVELKVPTVLAKYTAGTAALQGSVNAMNEGDRTSRGRVGFSIESPAKYTYVSGDLSGAADFRAIVFQIGETGITMPSIGTASSELIGVIHISFSGIVAPLTNQFALDEDDDIEIISTVDSEEFVPTGGRHINERHRAAKTSSLRDVKRL